MKRLCVAACVGLATLLWGQAQARELLYVEAQVSKDLHIIDARTFEEVGTAPIGFETDDVIGSHDGRFVYGNALVTNNNPVGGDVAGMAYAIDTKTNKILWWTYIPGRPQHLTVSLDDRTLFVPSLDHNYIYVVDTATGRTVDAWPSFTGNHGTELSHDGRHLYVGNMSARGLYVYDVETGRMVKSYPTRESVRPFKMDSAEKHAYYQLSNFHGFEVRNLDTGAIEKVVDLPKLPPNAQPGPAGAYDHGIAITPDEKLLLAASAAGGYVAVYAMPDVKFLGLVQVGQDPNWIRVRADSKVAFVANRGSNDVSAIDLATMKEIKRIPAGVRPARFDIVDVK
jgi:YVTN family beta-propeller protein